MSKSKPKKRYVLGEGLVGLSGKFFIPYVGLVRNRYSDSFIGLNVPEELRSDKKTKYRLVLEEIK